ncbi:MAG: sensor histidine kinase, partial [Actinobacteria bacterium]
ASRVAFWGALAEEQGRAVTVDVAPAPIEVAVPEADAVAMVDALIGNVLSHTEDGVAFAVALLAADGAAVLRVEDGGTGFSDRSVLERGRGHGTGLGLDIAKRTAESAGGSLEIGRSALGGASVVVTIPRRS